MEGGGMPTSTLLDNVVLPALAQAERAFSAALSRINVDDMARGAEAAVGRPS
jgi:hypothetical protein